ncbi:YIP1 family protein [Falsihalocynthiibacter sp. SS001]|uniref:YIP1 family protein n=1 Tax=Falsihalocynthiibacter sp. SS001 TaxID=3349698 RepID=UPI0036D30F6D
MTPAETKQLIGLLATKPRVGMRRALDMQIRGAALAQLGALVVVVTGIVGYISNSMMPVAEEAVAPSPLGYVVVAASNIVISSFVFFWAGRAIKGEGDLQDVALALILHQAFMVLFPLWLSIVVLTVPSIIGIAMIAGFVYLMYLMVGFIAEAHKFPSTWTALLLIVGVLFLLAFALLFFVSLLGIAPPA